MFQDSHDLDSIVPQLSDIWQYLIFEVCISVDLGLDTAHADVAFVDFEGSVLLAPCGTGMLELVVSHCRVCAVEGFGIGVLDGVVDPGWDPVLLLPIGQGDLDLKFGELGDRRLKGKDALPMAVLVLSDGIGYPLSMELISIPIVELPEYGQVLDIGSPLVVCIQIRPILVLFLEVQPVVKVAIGDGLKPPDGPEGTDDVIHLFVEGLEDMGVWGEIGVVLDDLEGVVVHGYLL